MKKALQEIVDKIINVYQPEKIILFGSFAWGAPGPDSDADLLVIKESLKPRFERTQELRALLYPAEIPMDILVYTPSELEEKISRDRNLFLEDVIRNGIVLYANDQLRETVAHSSR